MSTCRKCGKHIDELAEEGIYLGRDTPLGQAGEFSCRPGCDYSGGNQESALIQALEDTEADDASL